MLEKLCETQNGESLSNSVDQFGEIKPLVDRGKFRPNKYKRYVRIQADSLMVKW